MGAARLTILLAVVLAVAHPSSAAAQAGDRDCADFNSQAEAQEFFEANGGPGSDPHGLDGDGDGVACETLPCPCGSGNGDEPPPTTPGEPPDSPPGPKRTIERASSGGLVAELSYLKRRRGSGRFRFEEYRDLRVRIIRNGQVLRDEQVPRRCGRGCTPSGIHGDTAIRLRDLDADGEREVIVDLFTGGANCCVYTLIYGFSASDGSYKREIVDFGSGYRQRDRDRDGTIEFFAGDYRFKYKFSCGACSPQPLTIWQYQRFALQDASRSFPGALRRDARRMHRLYRRARPEPAFVKGILPAYAADMCRLRRCARAFRVVQRARRRGELARQGRYDIPPFNKAYVKSLRRFLRRTGYIR